MGVSKEIQNIAEKVKSRVEKELNKVFKTFKVCESKPIPAEKPETGCYSMKVKTSSDGKEEVKVHARQDEPGGEWLAEVEEFFGGVNPFENFFTPFDSHRVGFHSAQSLADSLKNDIERELNRPFKIFDVMDYHPILLADPENTSYYMRIKTDHNGQVRINTYRKKPGSKWETHVEEYKKGQHRLEGKKEEALEGEKRERGQEMETEQIKEKKTEKASAQAR